MRQLSDLICTEHKLSVILNPKRRGMSYNNWLGDNAKLSNRDLLRLAIDAALEKKPASFDELLDILKSAGYSVQRKKNISLKHENQKQSIRLSSLGDGYSEAELRTVIGGEKKHNPFVKKKYSKKQKPSLLSEIEAKLNSGKGHYYDQAMKVVKLKQMAKTFMFLEEKGFADYAELAQAADDAEARFFELKAKIKSAENRMTEIQTLRTHINNYSKTRDVYINYRKAGYSKKFLAEHEGDIILHKAAKKAFDELGLKKLPTVKALNAEFSELLSSKKSAYADYHRLKDEMRELNVHRENVAFMLGLDVQGRDAAEREHESKSDGTSRNHR